MFPFHFFVSSLSLPMANKVGVGTNGAKTFKKQYKYFCNSNWFLVKK
jgi:hypothetical protein